MNVCIIGTRGHHNYVFVGTVRLIDARKSYRLGERPAYYHTRATSGGAIPWGRTVHLINADDIWVATEACLLARQSADEGSVLQFGRPL